MDEILARVRKCPRTKVVATLAENYRLTGSNKYKMPSTLFTRASFLKSFLKSCRSFAGCTFNFLDPHLHCLFVCLFFVSGPFNTITILLSPLHLVVKRGRYTTPQQRQQSTNYVERINTTVSLKVNHQTFICVLLVINCGRRRRVIRYLAGEV